MEETEKVTAKADAGWLINSLDFVWERVVLGESKVNPEKSCFQLAADYMDSGKTPEECARNFINWQTGKAGVAGFALGLPGIAAMPLTIPADFASSAYIQLRMIAVIGILFGWEATSDQFRTTAFSCLLGTITSEAVRDVGVKASTRFGSRLVGNISGKSLQRFNTAIGIPRLLIKGVKTGAKAGGKATASATARAGSKGIINLTKMVPLLGGIVGGGLNIVFTRQMGLAAVKLLKDGPPSNKSHAEQAEVPGAPDGDEHAAIDATAVVVEGFVSNLSEASLDHENELGGHPSRKNGRDIEEGHS